MFKPLALLLSYVLLYQYTGLFVVVFLSGFGLPLPTTALLLATGAFASAGYFNLATSFMVVLVANVSADVLEYTLTRRYRMNIIHYLRFDQSRYFHRVEKLIRSHARLTIFATRFVGFLSPLTNCLAGISSVGFFTFVIYDVIGNVLYAGGLLGTGYLIGGNWTVVANSFSAIAVGLAVLVLIVVTIVLYRRRVTA